MSLLGNLLKKHKKVKQKKIKHVESCISELKERIQAEEDIFINRESFIEPEEETAWDESLVYLLAKLNLITKRNFRKIPNYKLLITLKEDLLDKKAVLNQKIQRFNDKLADKKISEGYALIGDVEGRSLDTQQMKCVVMEAHNQLIIAGAGTGKTTTVVGKIKYLLKSGKYNPQDILVLSFTNASASEMKERITKETDCNIEASTFHKLGLNIITKVDGVTPLISKISLSKFIKERLDYYMKDSKYLDKLSSYLLYNSVVSKSEFDFESKEEYDEYLKLNPPVTMKGEQVKSYGELDIANFFFQNHINYLYEEPYKIDTRTEDYAQYYPDFYLPDYDIYIEYFGINREGEVPEYFSGRDGLTGSEAYNASMEWKRKLHQDNNTVLIETFSYEHYEHTLLDNLKEKLLEKEVVFTPMNEEELMDQLLNGQKGLIEGIINLFQTVINLIKSNNYNLDQLSEIINNAPNSNSNNTVLDLVKPIYNDYTEALKSNNEIDFNDMINLATSYVREGKYNSHYKYVIVDEYQDISKARFQLLESLRKSHDYNLFCVGDDWQSIYRFAGSDINYILHFTDYWGKTQINKIETTYRFPQELIDVTSNFVMSNPAQIRKEIKGKRKSEGFAIDNIDAYTERKAIDFLLQRLDKLPKNSSVFFIGRYTFDVNMLEDNSSLSCRYNNVSGVVDVVYCNRKDLKMSFITAHKSKGLEADYVFIINNKNSKMGFPSLIQNSPIIDLLLDAREGYPHAEERRLYYVALTRARIKAYFVTVDKQESVFALELFKLYGKKLSKPIMLCPKCGGRLVERYGKYGKFMGCSNYAVTHCTYILKP